MEPVIESYDWHSTEAMFPIAHIVASLLLLTRADCLSLNRQELLKVAKCTQFYSNVISQQSCTRVIVAWQI